MKNGFFLKALFGAGLLAAANGASASATAVDAGADTASPSTENWRRAVTADGAVAITLPCAPADTQSKSENGTSGMSCLNSGLVFVLMVGAPAMEKSDFDHNLAEARSDPETGQVDVTELAGHKAFLATGRPSGPVMMAQFVDFRPGAPIVAMAMEERSGTISAADRPAAMLRASKFINSLEVLAK